MILVSLCPDITIDIPGRETLAVPQGKPGLLLLRLASIPNRSYGRDFLVESIWPGCEVEIGRPRLRFRFPLTILRQSLGLSDVLLASKNEVGLDWSELDTDLERFRVGIARAEVQSESPERARLLLSACRHIAGGLGEQYSAPWLDSLRNEILTARIDALRKAAKLFKESGEPREAEAALHEAIQLDPMRESNHGAYMRVLAEQDRTAEALAHDDEFRRSLLRTLGLSTSDRLSSLARKLATPAASRKACANPLSLHYYN